MKRFLTFTLATLLAGAGGWWLGSRHDAPSETTSATRKILHYQSPMHPWVKSPQPGKCTVCGMALVPVYEGEAAGAHAASTDLVLLAENSPHITGIRTAEVRRETLTRSLRFAGMIDDDDSRHRILSAYTGGRIEKLFVNYEGAEVQAGQPLALFYSRELLTIARDYALAVKQGQPQLKQAGELRLRQFGLLPEQIAKIPQRTEDDLFFELLAPISGTVVKRNAYEGQYVAEGERLFEIADFSRMWMQFIAYEQDLPFLHLGQPVSLTTPALPGKTLQSTIKFINPNLDDMTRSARVRVEVMNPTSGDRPSSGRELRHKTYAEATVQLELPTVLAVPRTAVLWPGQSPRVYLEKSPGAYEPRAVQLGRAGDQTWEVLSGLREGDKVVVSGNLLLDGQAQINGWAAPAPLAPALPIEPPADAEATRQYLRAVSALGDALANDDLAAYRTAVASFPSAPIGLPTPPPASEHLAATRKAYQPFSESVAQHATRLRVSAPEVRVYACPMSNQAAEGIPPNAKWIQLTASLRNPYMGKEMLECGTEVK